MLAPAGLASTDDGRATDRTLVERVSVLVPACPRRRTTVGQPLPLLKGRPRSPVAGCPLVEKGERRRAGARSARVDGRRSGNGPLPWLSRVSVLVLVPAVPGSRTTVGQQTVPWLKRVSVLVLARRASVSRARSQGQFYCRHPMRRQSSVRSGGATAPRLEMLIFHRHAMRRQSSACSGALGVSLLSSPAMRLPGSAARGHWRRSLVERVTKQVPSQARVRGSVKRAASCALDSTRRNEVRHSIEGFSREPSSRRTACELILLEPACDGARATRESFGGCSRDQRPVRRRGGCGSRRAAAYWWRCPHRRAPSDEHGRSPRTIAHRIGRPPR